MGTRDVSLKLRLSSGELASWRAEAVRREVSVSVLVRGAVTESLRPSPPSPKEVRAEPPRRDPDELVIPAALAKRLKALTPLDPLDLLARFVQASEAEKVRRSA